MQTQSEVYEEMNQGAATRYHGQVAKAVAEGEEHLTRYGQSMTTNHLLPLADAIKEWLTHNRGKRGVRHQALQFLEKVNPETAALATLYTVISSISQAARKARLFGQIGMAIEDEIRFAELKKSEPYLATFKKEEFKQLASHRKNAHGNLVKMFTKLELTHDPLTPSQRIIVGGVLFNLMQKVFIVEGEEGETIELLGIEKEMELRSKRKRMVDVVVAHPALVKLIESYNEHHQFLRPSYLPMIEKPHAWDWLIGGGYDVTELKCRPMRLVKNEARDYQTGTLRQGKKQLRKTVYPTLNAIQETEWQVNANILEVASKVWREGNGETFGLTSNEEEPLPPKPADIETNDEALKEWKRKAHKVYVKRREDFSQRLRTAHILSLAEQYKDSSVYFPHYLDFRGRVYSKPPLLSPQSDDFGKSLLQFRQGKPLDNQHAVNWLAVHGANVAGQDKIPMEERIAWVRANEQMIIRCAQTPLECREWLDMDKPWQFLAFCYEWEGYKRNGLSHITQLPVAMDGSNNGLQILSLLSRDSGGGESTNCTPSERPRDVYAEVANRVLEKLSHDSLFRESGEKLEKTSSTVESVSSIKEMATYLMAIGIDRKTVKRQVMVLPYGGTYRSTMDYTKAWLEDKWKELGNTSSLSERDLGVYLSRLVWDAINEGLEKPQEVMGWLRKCASLVSKHNKQLMWWTPANFLVFQRYLKRNSKEVKLWTGEKSKVRSLEQRQSVSVMELSDDVDPSRMQNGIAPNFVHSLDAACLMLTVQNMMKFGIESYAVIHDSFGTLAPDVDVMHACIRKAYADVFSQDQLDLFRQQMLEQLPEEEHCNVPPVPEFGDLNPRSVLESEFFFA